MVSNYDDNNHLEYYTYILLSLSDCVRWLKEAISFDVMKTQANAIIIRRGEMKEVLC
jgi:hypothetical protein